MLVVKHKRNSRSDRSQDSLDSVEKPPLLNRNLYQAPRRATFSKASCVPDSEVTNLYILHEELNSIDSFQFMVPLNSETSLSSSDSNRDSSTNSTSSDVAEEVGDQDEVV